MTISEQRRSFFDAFSSQAWPYQYHVDILINELHGGTPRNPDVVRSWLMAKAGMTDEREIQDELNRIFAHNRAELTVEDVERPQVKHMEEAIKTRADRQVNGFKRDEQGMYMEGRHLKACLKEAVSIARAADKLPAKYGTTGKGVIGFAAEHIFVPDDKLYMGRKEHDELHTRFVKTRFGSGITVEEVVYDVKLSATVKTDFDFGEQAWAMVWLTAESQGIGSSRSQGYGTFVVEDWYRIEDQPKKAPRTTRTRRK